MFHQMKTIDGKVAGVNLNDVSAIKSADKSIGGYIIILKTPDGKGSKEHFNINDEEAKKLSEALEDIQTASIA